MLEKKKKEANKKNKKKNFSLNFELENNFVCQKRNSKFAYSNPKFESDMLTNSIIGRLYIFRKLVILQDLLHIC